MPSSLFATVVVVEIVLGFAVLFAHRPDGGSPEATSETPTQERQSIQPASNARPRAGPAIVATPLAAAYSGASADAPKKASQVLNAEPSPPRGSIPAIAPPAAAAAATGMSLHVATQETGTAGDPAVGQKVFRKCGACHSLDPGKNLIGPSLGGIFGRKAGTEPNFSYSPAMKQANITWTPQTLATYLADPQKEVPGNRMPFPGLKSAHDRDDVIAYLLHAAGGTKGAATAATGSAAPASPPPAAAPKTSGAAPPPAASHGITDMPDVKYTLRTGIAEGRMVFLGVGGAIDGEVDPVLTAAEGQTVQITLINGEGAQHDVVFPDQNTQSPRVTGKGASTTIAFRAGTAGDFVYYCSVPGHRLAGMEGKFLVTPRPAAETVAYADISREPTDLPGPIGRRESQTVRVDLVAVEHEGRLAEGTTFGFWTFNGKVPGPFLRVKVGDRVEVHLKNSADSSMIHSVDFHAATGPGGGSAVLQVNPGDEKVMAFRALVPGLYVYHCATPMVAEHIANGMYGMILVEPEGGLDKVDHEFYLMQGEIYTDAAFGQRGSQEVSVEKLLAERPEYFVFNGSVGALTLLHPLHANVGESVRLFFGVGGPNFTSSFHVIGAIFDKVYAYGGVLSPPLRGLQTVSVAPGGAVIVDFSLKVPGNYTIVDHALARAERGLAATLVVGGNPNPDIYQSMPKPGSTGGH